MKKKVHTRRVEVLPHLQPTQLPEESKAQEASSPPKAQQPEESKASEASSPPKAPQADDSKESSSQMPAPSGEAKTLSPPKPQESKDTSPPEDDILDFTSATEGEEGGSSSAWDLVPSELPKSRGRKASSQTASLILS